LGHHRLCNGENGDPAQRSGRPGSVVAMSFLVRAGGCCG
jgi:hypothetical protein